MNFLFFIGIGGSLFSIWFMDILGVCIGIRYFSIGSNEGVC